MKFRELIVFKVLCYNIGVREMRGFEGRKVFVFLFVLLRFFFLR